MAHTKRGSSSLGSRPDTHPMAWHWTQALLCLGVKGHLSPFLPSPCIQHWACQGGLYSSRMNGFIQQYKLSTYCVPGHRQGPALMALYLVWEDEQIKVQLQGRQELSRARRVRKVPDEGRGMDQEKRIMSSKEERMMQRPSDGKGVKDASVVSMVVGASGEVSRASSSGRNRRCWPRWASLTLWGTRKNYKSWSSGH